MKLTIQATLPLALVNKEPNELTLLIRDALHEYGVQHNMPVVKAIEENLNVVKGNLCSTSDCSSCPHMETCDDGAARWYRNDKTE